MNTNITNKVSITEASKKLGINRSRLNQIINKSEIKKTKIGRVVLIEYNEIQNLIQTLAATGKIRTPKSSQQSKNQLDKTIDFIISELQFVRTERNQLKEKLTAAQSEISELRGSIKLLNTTPQDHTKQKLSWSEKGKAIAKILISSMENPQLNS